MSSITIRNIPEGIFDLVKTLAKTRKRSLNNELVLLIEKGILDYPESMADEKSSISKDTQIISP